MIYSDAHRPCITKANTGLMKTSIQYSYYGAWYERSKTVLAYKANSDSKIRRYFCYQSEPVLKGFSMRRMWVTPWSSIRYVTWRQIP